MFFPNLSIYHFFIYIIKFFYCLLLLGKIFTLNLKHYKTCSQHHMYTILDQISSFSYFIFSHMWLQDVTLRTRKFVLSYIYHVIRMSAVVYVSSRMFKINRVFYAANNAGIGGRCDVFFPG